MPKLTPPVSKNDHVQGLPGASIELVEYGDFQCPYCGAAYPVVKEIQNSFGENMRFIFRHFPLAEIHQYAVPAAIAAEAAARQHRFWEMHDLIYEKQSLLNEYALQEFAMNLGLNITAFKADMVDPVLAEKVETSFESGVRSGVNGTPSFFINGHKYNGSYDADSMIRAIERMMKETSL